MPSSYTNLLGFVLPVTGELSGTWGTTVNTQLTQLIEDSIANFATASVAGGNWTLSTASSGASNEARMMILVPTGAPGVSRDIYAPKLSKVYVVINRSNAAVVLRGGPGTPTTGVTIPAAQYAWCVWDASVSDFLIVGVGNSGTWALNTSGNAATASLATKTTNIAGGLVGQIPYQTALDTTALLAAGSAGQVLTSAGAAAPTWATPSAVLRGYIDGAVLSTAGSSATMTVAAGQAADSTNTTMLTLAAALSKTTSAWAVGSGNGGLDEGTIANTTYYYWFLIRRTDTGVVDAVCSQSPGTSSTVTMTIASPGVVTWTKHGLQAGAGVVFTTTGALPTGVTAGTRYYVISTGLADDTFQFSATKGGAAVNTSGSQSGVHTATAAPALPASYTQYRYIGGSLTNGSAQWTKFVQTGNDFYWDVPVLDVSASSSGTSAVLRTLTLPRRRVQARMNVRMTSAASGDTVYVSDPLVSDQAPSTTVAPLSTIGLLASGASNYSIAQANCYVNTAAQIRTRQSVGGASETLYIATLGWTDARGSDA